MLSVTLGKNAAQTVPEPVEGTAVASTLRHFDKLSAGRLSAGKLSHRFAWKWAVQKRVSEQLPVAAVRVRHARKSSCWLVGQLTIRPRQ
jgi:hypothetical protein